MANLYITSAENFSGKSALCISLGLHFRKDGLKVGYMKPVSIDTSLLEGKPYDEDVEYARKVFEMPESSDLVAPVALTPARFEQQLRGPEVAYEPKLMDAYQRLFQNRDLLIMEGGRGLREGYVAGLPPKTVVDLTQSRVIMVLKYADDNLMVDRGLTAQDYFGAALIGVVLNEVPKTRHDYITDIVIPFWERRGVHVLASLPLDPILKAPTIDEIAEGLNAEFLVCADDGKQLAENLMVGAMSAESALVHFRRKANKVVVTGGDRADIQMAALETSTRALILTGNLYPNPAVLRMAEEQNVSVLLTSLDTLSTIDTIEGFIGRSRVQQPEKLDRFNQLIETSLDYAAIYTALGLTPKK